MKKKYRYKSARLLQLVGFLLLRTIALFTTALLLPGIHLHHLSTALFSALLLGVINKWVRPWLLLITLPLNILSLGLFTLLLNGLLLMAVATLVPGFQIDHVGWAILLSLISWLFYAFLSALRQRYLCDIW